jgi:NDP-sugar pyrophosphorylase family protein
MLAVILAGGQGRRLRPYTTVLPKPLVPIGERPILSLLLDYLRANGVSRTIFCVNHMAELIMAYFGDGSRFGLPIEYAMEPKALGTVGPIRRLTDLPDQFLVLNGDILTDMALPPFFEGHRQGGSLLTVATTTRQVKIDFGVLNLSGDAITGFREKPQYDYQVSMGIYAFSRGLLDHVPPDTFYGFDQLMLHLLDIGEPVRAHRHDGQWLDIGRPDDCDLANSLVSQDPLEGLVHPHHP